jgi:hypothetical protein
MTNQCFLSKYIDVPPDIAMEYGTAVYSANQREPEWETV